MVRSMTAFARQEGQLTGGSFCWELRSVNHRYLELNVRLPEELRSLEPQVREAATLYLRRGKVEINLRWISDSSQACAEVQTESVMHLLAAVGQVNALTGCHDLPPVLDILRWPGVLLTPQLDRERLFEQLLAILNEALAQLVAHRQREGAQLAEFIVQRLDQVEKEVANIRGQLTDILLSWRERLFSRLSEIQESLNSERLEQEMAVMAQRIDIHEELDRLQTHISEVRKALIAAEPVGRRLDFLMQELNREANTLGSKSIHATTSLAAVNLKVLIEQMREQVQNIE